MQTGSASNFHSSTQTKLASLDKTSEDSILSQKSETLSLENSCYAILSKKNNYALEDDRFNESKIGLIQANDIQCMKKPQTPQIIEYRTIQKSQGPPKSLQDEIIKTKRALCFVMTQLPQQLVKDDLSQNGLGGGSCKIRATRNIYTQKHMLLIELSDAMKLDKFVKVSTQLINNHSQHNDDIQLHQISRRMALKNDHELEFASVFIRAMGQTITTRNNNIMFANLIDAASLTLFFKRLQYEIVPNPLNTDILPSGAQLTEIEQSLRNENRLRSFEFDEIKKDISSLYSNELNSVQTAILLRLTQKVVKIEMAVRQSLTIAQEWLLHSVDI